MENNSKQNEPATPTPLLTPNDEEVCDVENVEQSLGNGNYSDEGATGKSTRLRVENLPPFYGMKQVRKLLKDNLDGMTVQRLKTMSRVAIFSLASEADTDRAIAILRELRIKKFELGVKRVANESCSSKPSHRDHGDNDGQTAAAKGPTTASDLVTPLAGIPYEEQLERKFDVSRSILNGLLRQIANAGVPAARQWKDRLRPVLPSPVTTGYRNKCEFCVARSDGAIRVGFVQGRMAEREIRIADVTDCANLTANTLCIVRRFEAFVRDFDARLDAFDEFQRTGFWKMLTVRDFHGDCMLVVTAHPYPDTELVGAAKRALVNEFLRFGEARQPVDFRVTSLYWQTIENASDAKVYEHLAGAPYIYETILGARFRISPSTFFQTNSRGAELLYARIGDALGLPSLNAADAASAAVANMEQHQPHDEKSVVAGCQLSVNGDEAEDALEVESENEASAEDDKAKEDGKHEDNGGDAPTEAKRQKIDDGLAKPIDDVPKLPSSPPTVVLDICCGSGSIGICLMKRMCDLTRLRKFSGPYGCVGVEIVPDAIHDANINAANNGFAAKSCRYITGQAENIFKELHHYMPEQCDFNSAELLGVVDPPRAGVADKVVVGCRKLNRLKHLVYVSCDPRVATKNLTDLCRPTSNKYEGRPFRIVAVQPIDMFPLTEHFEWIVSLERD